MRSQPAGLRPIGHICSGNACVPGCTSDRDCPQGLYCAANQGDHGACVECIEDTHCLASYICHNNTCTFSCTSAADCSPPLPVCDTQSGACVACLAKGDCNLGHLCVDQVCVPGCEDDRDCPAGQECQGGQCREVCVPSGEEVCDTVDNNCDGRTDAADPQLSATTWTPTATAPATTACSSTARPTTYAPTDNASSPEAAPTSAPTATRAARYSINTPWTSAAT